MSRRVRLLGWLAASGLALVLAGSVTLAAEETKPKYVGVNKCKMCHMPQFKAWSATKHATAFAALEKADPKATAAMATKLKIEMKETAVGTEACVKCHVTGFKQAGGYPAADAAMNAHVANVTCEACHGPGSAHVAAPKAQKKATMSTAVTEATCKSCHTAELSPSFDFAKKKGLVHPVPKS